jgi:penicillin amidase
LPDAQLPAIFGGPYLASANNDPWGHTADNDPLNDDFYYGSFYAPGFRAARLREALGALVARGGVTVEENQALQLEQRSQLAPRLLPFLSEAVGALESDPALEPWRGRAAELRAALGRLERWDQVASTQSAEALLFRLWVAWATRRLLADDLGLLFDPVDEAQAVTNIKLALLTLEQDLVALHEGQPRVALVRGLAEALDTLAARPGLQTWGDLHRASFDRPVGPPLELETGGEDTSLNVAQSACWRDGAIADFCRSGVGAVFRSIVTFGEDGVPQLDFQWPEGNALTTEAWLEGRYARLPFRRAEVEARTTRTLTLPAR